MIEDDTVHLRTLPQARRPRIRARTFGRVVVAWVIASAGIVAPGALIDGGPANALGAAGAVGGAAPRPAVSALLQAASAPESAGVALPAHRGRPATLATNVYAGTGAGMFSPTVANVPPRVYVPDEASGTVAVIDPITFRILFRYRVGASPEHVTPDWDLKRLYVEATFANLLTVINPKTGRPVGHHSVPGPYNLYFTLDGRMAIVVLDSRLSGARQLSFYDRRTWRLIKALSIPWAGADHLDFSADGRYLLLSTEYSARVVRVDVRRMRITGVLNVGGNPIDVRLAPDGRVFYVANYALNGVSIVDAAHMRRVGFVRTGSGAHGLAISRDARFLYVTNRRARSLSVIDFATRKVVHTWRIGGSPDMIAVSPDGARLWISNRYGGTVSVVNPLNGHVIRIIRVGGRPHGLAYFPEPGSLCLGHNGIYR